MILPQIQLNGTSLYYEKYGAGVPLVFIHDHLTSHHLFEPQVEYFRKRLQVIVLDLRGSGLSGKMNVEVNRILDTQCEDLRALLENLGIPKVILVACSSGGVLAQKFAVQHPEQVSALVLVDSGLFDHISMKNRKLWDFIETCTWISHYLPAEFFIRSLRMTYNKWLPAYHILRKELLHKRPTELIKQRIALRQIDMFAYAERLRIPVLCVAGSQNEWGLKQARRTAALFPAAQLAVLPDAMYPSHLCQPQDFNRLLLNFLMDQHLRE
ncbi:alpha/beta hydrolase [Paenibacillus albidus]|uniref:Alpha/beta hydrolase n=1 Tax=Paenibacillus albidus TaxID=2041023 RepID=A0A917C4Q1_9BACL|nr:alpha/beta hydrolase [Paenibacillus albidus]